MSRFSPYLGIVAALALGVLIFTFLNNTTVLYTPEVTAITSPSIVPIEDFVPAATTATTSTQTASTPVPKKITPPTPKQTPAPIPVTPVSPTDESIAALNASLDNSAAVLRAALVNIICYAPAGSGLHSISGSGVIIDPKGIILTNAHIAQYFLLADRSVSCTIRSGSPAADRYDADLIYISPAWLRANPTVLTQTLPNGNGEYDFALLAISTSASGGNTALPSVFSYIPLAITPPANGAPVAIASYGAQFLESSQVQSGLFPTIVFGSVKDIFTFGINTIDVLALGGSAAAQEGSSGGGVADASGDLVGTITTSTVTGATDTRSLDAITASYIRSEYASETGIALDILLAKPTATSISDFSSQTSALESIITAHLH